MRFRSPSSRAGFRLRFSKFDLLLAAVSPLAALYLRDAYILLNAGDIKLVVGYCLVSLMCSVVAFAAFGIRGGIPRDCSVHELIDIGKAVAIGDLLTCVALFSFTRLEGIPRSTPAIHALLLGAGLVVGRALSVVADNKRRSADRRPPAEEENIILIGVSDLAVLYMKLLEAAGTRRQRVIGLLDDEPRWIGRSVNGVRVLGSSADLEPLIDEFAVHGICTGRVVIGRPAGIRPDPALPEIRRVCDERGLECLFIPQLLGLESEEPAPVAAAAAAPAFGRRGFSPPEYFKARRALDLGLALALLAAALPLWALACGLAFLDVGSPVFFWQQRVGLNGRNFLLYKLRTLSRRHGWSEEWPADARVSWIGRLLRRTRIDEFPQLLNVIVGDMALIGPRPLLPHDQPLNPTIRLMVRPGITGWAQVHGGALLASDEKEALDEAYVRNASLRLDLRILAMTVATLFRGDRRSDKLLARARSLAEARRAGVRQEGEPATAAAAAGVGSLAEDGKAPAVLSS